MFRSHITRQYSEMIGSNRFPFPEYSLPVPVFGTLVLRFLYGCETGSRTLREERGLRVLKSRVLRKIFGPQRDEQTGECRKRRNEELRDLYSLSNIIRLIKSRRMRWGDHLAVMEERRDAYRVLVGRPEGKRPPWEDNVQMDLQEVEGTSMDWIELTVVRGMWQARMR